MVNRINTFKTGKRFMYSVFAFQLIQMILSQLNKQILTYSLFSKQKEVLITYFVNFAERTTYIRRVKRANQKSQMFKIKYLQDKILILPLSQKPLPFNDDNQGKIVIEVGIGSLDLPERHRTPHLCL